jgi:hypothetical protein
VRQRDPPAKRDQALMLFGFTMGRSGADIAMRSATLKLHCPMPA